MSESLKQEGASTVPGAVELHVADLQWAVSIILWGSPAQQAEAEQDPRAQG